MPPRRRELSGFRGVRAWPNELAARTYYAAVWRFRRPRRDLTFSDVESLEEAEFLAPPQRLLDDEDRHHHQAQRRLAIAERDKELMHRWKAQYPSDVANEAAFFNDPRVQRRV
ncbi:uncharacterized protein [Lolium perenne]|uniref:uncharacterized protein n=1 Tax=Lolium perenne TaxID=4522 RepID=UPI0021F5A7DD|nr:uncharacterized protein LOC127303128 [Lolium perenne]